MQQEGVEVRGAQPLQRVWKGLERARGAEVAWVQLAREEELLPLDLRRTDCVAQLLLEVPLLGLRGVKERVPDVDRVLQRRRAHVAGTAEADERHHDAVAQRRREVGRRARDDRHAAKALSWRRLRAVGCFDDVSRLG